MQGGATARQGQIPDVNKSLFFQNYINTKDASKDHETGLQNVAKVQQHLQQATGQNVPFNHTCHVYPPLLIRYDDPQKPIDQFVPVDVYPGGELHPAQGVPDMVINFHIDTGAITVTTCRIDPKKLKNFELAVWALYSMYPGQEDQKVDVAQFTTMYDQTRYELLRAMSLRAKMTGKTK